MINGGSQKLNQTALAAALREAAHAKAGIATKKLASTWRRNFHLGLAIRILQLAVAREYAPPRTVQGVRSVAPSIDFWLWSFRL